MAVVSEMRVPHNPHDLLFKDTLGQPEQARAYLAEALPEALIAQLDLQTLQRVAGSFVDEELRERHTDLLFELTVRARQPCLVYLLMEHPSTPDPRKPFRLLAYTVRIWQRWLGEHPTRTRLPPVLPLVLYHGARR